MIPTAPTADALFYPEKLKRGGTFAERVDSVLDVAEPMLGVDRPRGERGYIRKQDGGWLFITKDIADTINFPITHPLRGRPRYQWVDGPDGIRLGYLVAEARADMEKKLAS